MPMKQRRRTKVGCRHPAEAPKKSGRKYPKAGRELASIFAKRARFQIGCDVCQNLSEDYTCVMPYHEWHANCEARVPHCTCIHCWGD